MSYGIRVSFDGVREIGFGALSDSYAAVGTATTKSIRLISMVNATDAEVYISFDGVNDHVRLTIGTGQTVTTGSFRVFNLTANKVDGGFMLPKGTIFYVREVAAGTSSGSVWIEVMTVEGGS